MSKNDNWPINEILEHIRAAESPADLFNDICNDNHNGRRWVSSILEYLSEADALEWNDVREAICIISEEITLNK